MSPHRLGARPPAWLGTEGLPFEWRREVSRGVARSMALALGLPLVWSVVYRLAHGDWQVSVVFTALYVPLLVAALAPLRSAHRAGLSIFAVLAIGLVLAAMGRGAGAGPIFIAVTVASLTLGTHWAVAVSVAGAAGLALANYLSVNSLVPQATWDDGPPWLRHVAAAFGLCLGLVAAHHVVLRSLERSLYAAKRLLDDFRREARERGLLARRLAGAEEHERRRIARDLHDDIGQRLTALKLQLQLAFPPGDAPSADAIGIADGLLRDIRSLSRDLRPALLDELGLLPAARALAEAQQGAFDVAVDIAPGLAGMRLPPEVEIACYRALQEAIANALRHAGASRLTLTAAVDAESLELALADDGRGFDPGAVAANASGQHLGFASMRERMSMIGGAFAVESAPGRGTTVRLSLPLALTGLAAGPAA